MVTIVDVARAAGVAPSTVSYVISGKRRISPSTRQRVEQCIRDLGYHPNAGARALATSRTNVLALAVPLRPDLNLSVIMQFVSSVVTSAREHGLDLLLLTKDDGPAELRRVASSAIADALIVMDVESAAGAACARHLAKRRVLTGLAARGLRVPDDISVIALCPDNMAENGSVPLTSVAIPAAEVGALAVRMTIRQLSGRTEPETHLLPPRVTVRDSTKRATARI